MINTIEKLYAVLSQLNFDFFVHTYVGSYNSKVSLLEIYCNAGEEKAFHGLYDLIHPLMGAVYFSGEEVKKTVGGVEWRNCDTIKILLPTGTVLR